MLNRIDFAKKSLYGAGIISHILKECYPGDEVVMKIKGRDCGTCRNPFDDGNPTLKVWIERLHPEEKLSDEPNFQPCFLQKRLCWLVGRLWFVLKNGLFIGLSFQLYSEAAWCARL